MRFNFVGKAALLQDSKTGENLNACKTLATGIGYSQTIRRILTLLSVVLISYSCKLSSNKTIRFARLVLKETDEIS